ncbi:MAG: tetratricopeptide repeat protein [Deltaproteobacteria bacterium]|nr:tetratricopeptide repeat protein [Deltaproteobacteria bacterium]
MRIRMSGYVLRMAVVMVLAIFFLSPPGICSAFRNLKKGETPPDFVLKDLAGMDHSLSAEKGKVVILCFVKGVQDRSIKALNGLTNIYASLKDRGLSVYAISENEESLGSLQSLKKKLDLKFPVLLDEEKKIYGEYGLFIFPATAVIDQEGRFVFEYSSYGSDFERTLMDEAKLLLGLISEEEMAKSETRHEIQELTPEAKEAKREMQMARVLISRRMGSKALPKLLKALELDPSLPGARLLAGRLYIEAENFQAARAEFEKVLESDPGSHDAHVGLGTVYLSEGNLDAAEAQLQKAVALNPDPALALYRLGQVYEKMGETRKAMITYRDAIYRQLKKEGKIK